MAGSKTILFIEDDPFIVDMYKHVLAKAGYIVDVAYDGQAGYQQALSSRYDLLLVDIMVPTMTGIEVIEKLRRQAADQPTPKIIVLTNLAQDEESRRALEAEADGYLIKADITPKKLVQLITEVMAQGSANADTAPAPGTTSKELPA